MMQTGGIGRTYGMDSHQVTDCMHEHVRMKQETGAKVSSRGLGINEFQNRQSAKEIQVPLTNLLLSFLGKIESFFKGLWGSNTTASLMEDGTRTGQQAVLQPDGGSLDIGSQNIYKTTVPGANPYFQTLQELSLIHI